VPLFDLNKLAQKRVFVLSRAPGLVQSHRGAMNELQQRANDVLNMIASAKLKLRIEHLYPLKDAQRAHSGLGKAEKTTGKLPADSMDGEVKFSRLGRFTAERKCHYR